MQIHPDFITADTYFYHTNIIKYCDRPQNHNELMVTRWNERVGTEDVILHLGDFAFAKGHRAKVLFESLNGYKMIFRGNHDKGKNALLEMGWSVVYSGAASIRVGNKNIVFSHYPIPLGVLTTMATYPVINVHGHIHNNGYGSDMNLTNEQIERYYRNVSVEVTNYYPLTVAEVIEGDYLR